MENNNITPLRALEVIEILGEWDINSSNKDKYMTIAQIKQRFDLWQGYNVSEEEIEQVINVMPSLFATHSHKIGEETYCKAYRLNFMHRLFEMN